MTHKPVFTYQQRKWRIRIFALTWLAYAGFYLCRKNYSVAMPILSKSFGASKEDFAIVLTAYSLMYMLGQFLNGFLSDKKGPRFIVGTGLLVAVTANLLMGWMGTLGSFIFLMGLNGLGQSTGWSGTIKNMAPWFRHQERGVVMSFWSTCYVIGGIVGSAFATYCATNQQFFVELSWKRAFFAPALALTIIAILYLLFTKNNPQEAGLKPFFNNNESKSDEKKSGLEKKNAQQEVIKNTAVWVTAGMYFFIKFTRYAFLFWLPLYLSEALNYSVEQAGYTSVVYEAVGFAGVIAAGVISDRLYKSRRFPIGAIMLFALVITLLFQPLLTSLGIVPTIIAIGLIGFFTYGPDSLMSGAAAMDLGNTEGAALAAGIINGVGSAGQLLSPVIVAYVADNFGWNALFKLFVVFAFIGGVLLTLKWNYGKNNVSYSQ